MDKHLILSIISDDKPGIVNTVAKTVKDYEGNWLESQLSQLAGKFAGIIRVCTEEQKIDDLSKALINLKSQGIKVHIEELQSNQSTGHATTASFTAVGPDRPGIVMEISQALSRYNINVENLATQCSSMPYSGDPLFEAEGILGIPSDTPMEELYDVLCKIADQLAMDIHLEEPTPEETPHPD